MKKYNTPEIIVSKFNTEEILTDSADQINEWQTAGYQIRRFNFAEQIDQVAVEY